MPDKIKLDPHQIGIMSFFENLTGATVRDCVIDNKMDRVILIVSKGQMGLAIGKAGSSVRSLEKAIGKTVEIVEYSDDLLEFVRNSLTPKYILEMRATDKPDGSKDIVIVVDEKHKGAVVGKEGRNAEKARLLARRYFQVSGIHIVAK